MRKSKSSSSSAIDLNAATVQQLVAAGFSSTQAEAVLGHSAEHGHWTSLEQLLVIDGIDAVALHALRPSLYVAPNAVEAPTDDPMASTDADSGKAEGAKDADSEAEGGIGMSVSESSGDEEDGSLPLEPEDPYPAVGAVAEDEYWPELAPSEPPSSDVTAPESIKPEPSETCAGVADGPEGDVPAVVPEGTSEPAATTDALDPASTEALYGGVAVACEIEDLPEIEETAVSSCLEARREKDLTEPHVVGEPTMTVQAADTTGTWEGGSHSTVEETADVPVDTPSSADEHSAPETLEARLANLEGDRVQAPEAEAADQGVLHVVAPVGVEPEGDFIEIEGIGAASAMTAGASAVARPGGTIKPEPAKVQDTAASVTSTATGPAPRIKSTGKSRWHDMGLVAVGGLLGMLATLVILGLLGGTLSYAPRALVDALSENLSTMQQNQETTWSRTQSLVSEVADLEARLGAVEALDSRVTELERGSADTEARLSELRTGLQKLDSSLAEVAERHATLIDDLSSRVAAQEAGLTSMGATVRELVGTIGEIQDQVTKYEAFFDALRELLLEMQGEGAGADTGM